MMDTDGAEGPAAALRNPIEEIVASYHQPVIRIYSKLRFTILRQLFLEEIGQYLPTRGSILDICENTSGADTRPTHS